MNFRRIAMQFITLPLAVSIVLFIYWTLNYSISYLLSGRGGFYPMVDVLIVFGFERLLFYAIPIVFNRPIRWWWSLLLSLVPAFGLILLYRWTILLWDLIFRIAA